jgi:hypothetical protein
MALPANSFSRRPGFVCPGCGALMRPVGTTAAYGAVTAVGGFVFLLGAIMAIASVVNPTAFQENQLHGAVLVGALGALVGGWAVRQLRLATPLGATAQPVGRRFWIIMLGVVLFVLLAFGAGIFGILYLLHERM